MTHLAADEITRLTAENERLRALLREAVYEATHLSPQEPDGSHWAKMSAAWLAQARAELTETSDDKT